MENKEHRNINIAKAIGKVCSEILAITVNV